MKRRSLVAVLLIGACAAAATTLWLSYGALGGPDVSVEPRALDFGRVALGSEAKQLVVATNRGSEPVIIDAIRVDGPFQLARKSLALEPGASAELVVRYAPQESGRAAGALRLESAQLRGGSLDVQLAGEAHRPAEIAVDPLFVSFGSVAVSGVAKALLTIRNTGEDTLEVDALAAGRPFAPGRPSVRVEPGASESVEILFQPSATGLFQDTIAIRSNDPAHETVVVTVEGQGVATSPTPMVKVTPPSVDFGSVAIGGTGQKWVSIRNVGSDPLTITSVTVPAPFVGPTRSRVVAPGSEFSLPVVFSPAAEGSQSGPLRIYTNDPQAGVLTVGLSGAGVAAGSTGSTAQGDTQLAAGGTGAPGGARGAATDGGEGSGDEGSAPPVDGDDTGTAVQPDVLDGSQVRVGSYGAEFGEGSVEGISYDPGSGLLQIDGLQLPEIGAALGEYFRFSPTSGAGIVDGLGEATIVIPIELLDPWGNPTHMVMELTTSVSSATYDRTVVSMSGSPCGPDGRCTFVGQITQPSGSPFGGEPMKVTLNVQIPKKSR